jgi:hypothetical protein
LPCREFYNNNVAGGEPAGYWMIDDKDTRLPVYHMYATYLAAARSWVQAFKVRGAGREGGRQRQGRVPLFLSQQYAAVGPIAQLNLQW